MPQPLRIVNDASRLQALHEILSSRQAEKFYIQNADVLEKIAFLIGAVNQDLREGHKHA